MSAAAASSPSHGRTKTSSGGGGGRIRTCKRCKFSTNNGKEFLQHQKLHQEASIEVYACEKCEYISHSYDDLIQHKRSLHPVTPSKPRNSASSVSSLHGTNIIPTPVERQKPEVIRTTCSPDAFADRYGDDPNTSASSSPPRVSYVCGIDGCTIATSSPKLYYRHRRDRHGEGEGGVGDGAGGVRESSPAPLYECTLCSFATRIEQRLEAHVLRHGTSASEGVELEDSIGFVPEGVDLDGGEFRDRDLEFVPEGVDENGEELTEGEEGNSGLQIDEDSDSTEHDFKSPLQIVMEMNAANHSMLASDSAKMSSAFLAAMQGRKSGGVGIPKPRAQSSNPNTPGKPRCTPVREAVDPAKYMTIQEGDGIKYACSKCGNIYKWRKSLNKHWKEKHDGEVPDPRSSAVTALNLPGRLSSNAGNISHLMGISSSNHQSLLMAGKGGAFRPVSITSPSGSTPVRPQAMFSTAHFGLSGLSHSMGMGVGASMGVYSSHGGLQLKQLKQDHGQHPQRPSLPSSFPAPTAAPAPAPYAPPLPRPPAMSPPTSSPGLPQPPAAHGSKPHPFLSPPSSRKSSASVYDEPFDEQDGVLDLSKKSNPVPEIPQSRSSLAPQDQPIDFSALSSSSSISSSNSSNSVRSTRYPPPPLSTDPSRRHLISPQNPGGTGGTELSPIVIEPVMPGTVLPASVPSDRYRCTKCSYIGADAEELEVHRQLHRDISPPPPSSSDHQRLNSSSPETYHPHPHSHPYTLDHRPHRCAECTEAFSSLDRLTEHFAREHMEVLRQRLDENETNNTTEMNTSNDNDNNDRGTRRRDEDRGARRRELYHWLSVDVSLRPPSHTVGQETTCLVCGEYYQWQDALENHFNMVHPQLPNPYTLNPPTSPGALAPGHAHPSPRGSPGASPGAGGREELLTPDGRQLLGFEDENTAIVIPVAPEDAPPPTTPGRKKPGRKSNTVHALDKGGDDSSAELLLPYKCSVCEYRARWPSEITQHMKNHSDEKPYKCPRCSYRSKWKWDVVKHLKRCGGGTVKDVIDTTKLRRQMHVNAILAGVPSLGGASLGASPTLPPGPRELSRGPPNVTVAGEGGRGGGGRKRAGESMSSVDVDVDGDDSADDTEGTCGSGIQVVGSAQSEGEGGPGGVDSGASGVSVTGAGDNTLPLPQQYFCAQCPFIATGAGELKRHERVHTEDKPFICKTCGYCSKWKCDLKKHLRTYNHQSAVPLTYGGHGRKPVDWAEKEGAEREQESDEEEEKSELQNQKESPNSHQNNNNHKFGIGKLKCKQCDFTADDLPSFLQHKISHQMNSTSPTKREAEEAGIQPMKHRRKPLKQDITKTVSEGVGAYACGLCMFTSDHSHEFYQHVRSEHSENMDTDGDIRHANDNNKEMEEGLTPTYACDFCTWTTEDGAELYRHVQSEHQQDLNGDASDLEELKIYRGESRKVAKRRLKHCDKCAYVTDNISTLQRHMSKHGKNAKYLCEFCDYSVEREHIIEYHMSHVHKDQYVSNDAMNAAIDIRDPEEYPDHDDEEEEGYVAQDENSMDDDQTHANDPESEIERGYSVLQIHNGKRTRYGCLKCPYTTENLTNMTNHARQHGALKRYTCEFCDYSLDQQRHILKHMKTQHGHDAAMTEDGEEDGERREDEMNGDGDEEEEHENNENEEVLNEEEWDITEMDAGNDDETTPSKRRRLSRISTSSASSIFKYCCKTCGFDTVNKTQAAKHNHKDTGKIFDDKFDAKEENVDINRNMTIHQD